MQNITFRQYIGDRTAGGDYTKIHDFLVKTGRTDYTYGRFDWMMTNWEYLEDRYLERIGIWEDKGEVVGVILFDHSLDVIFPIILAGFEELYAGMIRYAADHMVRSENPEFLIYANDSDEALMKVLRDQGFTPIEGKEMVSRFDLSEKIPEFHLPDGYSITDLQEEAGYEQYYHCMFKGFGHEEAGEIFYFDEERLKEVKIAHERQYLDLRLKVSIKNSEGNYVSHCGMWYDRNSDTALIEPVCTVPECRRMGLGKAAVLEGLRRVKELGAKRAVVGSNQQFYYSLGMIPHETGTLWKTGE